MLVELVLVDDIPLYIPLYSLLLYSYVVVDGLKFYYNVSIYSYFCLSMSKIIVFFVMSVIAHSNNTLPFSMAGEEDFSAGLQSSQ